MQKDLLILHLSYGLFQSIEIMFHSEKISIREKLKQINGLSFYPQLRFCVCMSRWVGGEKEKVLPKVLIYLRSLGICILMRTLINLFFALKLRITAKDSLKHYLRISEIFWRVLPPGDKTSSSYRKKNVEDIGPPTGEETGRLWWA